MKWLQIQNNFILFESNNLIRYVPNEIPENIKIHEKGEYSKYTSIIQSADYFENGKIDFKLILKEKSAFFNIEIGRKMLFSINSGAAKSAFSIRQKSNNGTEIIEQKGAKESLIIDHEYSIRIEVIGSVIRIFVDDVELFKEIQTIENSQVKVSMRSYKEMYLKDFKVSSKKPKAFVVMQFEEVYNELYKEVIKPVCEQFGYDSVRADEIFNNGSILKDIIDSINESSVIIADITPDNPNVFYELGYAHALNKSTIILSDKTRNRLPFDVSNMRTLFYDNSIGGKSKIEAQLKNHLENIKISA